MFPSSEVELPDAAKFNAFPAAAQEAILLAFRTEQQERHAWLKQQQSNDHELNVKAHNFVFWRQMCGTGGGVIIVVTMVVCGAVLIAKGASASGIAMVIVAVAGLAGTALYGHNAQQSQTADPSQAQLPDRGHQNEKS